MIFMDSKDWMSTPNEMWYIASPYACPVDNKESVISRIQAETIQQRRYFEICEITAELINNYKNVAIFSPIAYTHHLSTRYGADPEMGWYAFDLKFLMEFPKTKSTLVVVMMDGWAESVGVNLEICTAMKLGIPIKYYCPVERKFKKEKDK